MSAPKPRTSELPECRDKGGPGSPSNRVSRDPVPILELKGEEVEMQGIPLLISTTRGLNKTLS